MSKRKKKEEKRYEPYVVAISKVEVEYEHYILVQRRSELEDMGYGEEERFVIYLQSRLLKGCRLLAEVITRDDADTMAKMKAFEYGLPVDQIEWRENL